MVRARLHVICGNCGCNDMFTYKIDPEGHDVDGQLLPAVTLCCGNCATLHDLADNAREESPKKKLVRPAAGYPRDPEVPSLAWKETKWFANCQHCGEENQVDDECSESGAPSNHDCIVCGKIFLYRGN